VAKYTIIEARDAGGGQTGWTVLDLPDDFKEGDPYPAPAATDRHYETRADAERELERRIGLRTGLD